MTGDEPDQRAGEVREERRRSREGENAPSAPENAAQDVATEEVGAERKAFGRPRERNADRLVGCVRRDERAEQCDRDDEHQQREPDRACARSSEPEPAHSAVRSFGTRSTTSRSATILIAM